jgi:RNA polymerase sigma-B factor
MAAAKRSSERGPKGPGDAPAAPTVGLADDLELLKRFHATRDPAIREELVNRYMQFARSMALRYRGGSEPTEDLIQVASLGLVNAIDRFDPERGIPFLAFAAPTVLGELRRHFRDRVWNLRLPRGLQERVSKVDETVAKLTTDLERSPTVAEIAESMEISEDDVLEAFSAASARRTASFEAPVGGADGEDARLGDRIGTEEEGYERVEAWATLAEGLPALSERERTVLRLRFVEDLTQSQIAEQIGHSQMHVSRILRGALAQLREELEGGTAEEPGDSGD